MTDPYSTHPSVSEPTKRKEPRPGETGTKPHNPFETAAVMATQLDISGTAEIPMAEATAPPLNQQVSEYLRDVLAHLNTALNKVEAILKRNVVMGEAERVAAVLWIAHTYVYSAFKLTPRLFITSASPGSGKTTLLSMVADMSSGGKKLNKATEAYLGRLKDEAGPRLTVALDQLDNALDVKATGTGQMLDRLISGADHGSIQGLVDKGKDGNLGPVELDLFYPLALAKIGSLPSAALIDRCILIQMHPATKEESKRLEKNSPAQTEQEVKYIRSLLTAVFRPHKLPATLAAVPVEIPEELINRARDKWRSLFAIADTAGSAWARRARNAAIELELSGDKELPKHVTLLCRVVNAIRDWPYDVIFSEELHTALNKDKSGVWWNNMTRKARGRLLTMVGLKSANVRRGDTQRKGYRIEAIQKAASQYLQRDA